MDLKPLLISTGSSDNFIQTKEVKSSLALRDARTQDLGQPMPVFFCQRQSSIRFPLNSSGEVTACFLRFVLNYCKWKEQFR